MMVANDLMDGVFPAEIKFFAPQTNWFYNNFPDY